MKHGTIYTGAFTEFVGFSEEHVIAKYCLQHTTVKINDANVVNRTQTV